MSDAPCFTVTRYRLTVVSPESIVPDITEYVDIDAALKDARRMIIDYGCDATIETMVIAACPCCDGAYTGIEH